MKNISRALALAMVAALTLTGCGGNNNGSEGGNNGGSGSADVKTDAIKDLVITKAAARELETFNILYSQREEDTENLTNLVDGLLESNPAGELVPCIAKTWDSEDGGQTWTFNLRDNVKWVDVNGSEKAATTAQDFATGLEWVLNFYKNDSSNTAMPLEMIVGANEYYEWTKTLSEEEALALTAEDGSKFREMVKMETPDDYTVVYHCTTKMPTSHL